MTPIYGKPCRLPRKISVSFTLFSPEAVEASRQSSRLKRSRRNKMCGPPAQQLPQKHAPRPVSSSRLRTDRSGLPQKRFVAQGNVVETQARRLLRSL